MMPGEIYDRKIAEGQIKPDAAQAEVIAALDQLASRLEAKPPRGLFGRRRKMDAVGGLYIHGDVGRGKTMLMDLFFEAVTVKRKRRIHFHAFMQDVHQRLHAARKTEQDAIAPVAEEIAGESRLLCLDEMQITDIADAMIVGRLFTALLEQGTTIVTTSNLPPSELYRDGLNRQLFLPFIDLLEEKLEVLSLDGETDYRLGRIVAEETFITPLGPEADRKLQVLWEKLTDTKQGKPMQIELLGRKLTVPEATYSCARFSFAQLCGAALGAADYLALTRQFRTIFVTGIPALSREQRNEAKRFVLLIDTLYDAGTRLVASSAVAPEEIYPEGDHRFEFGRTVSRLKEMQSAGWWTKKIAKI
jgi:cell division protein ZapE